MEKISSADGTPIAYDKTGTGPALILFDGAFCSRNFGPMPKLVPLLSPHFTVFAYDRRARGDSGDTQPYAIEREIEDLEAMIDVAGGSAFVFSISSGAVLALHAVASGRLSIKKLAIYEPPFVVDKAASTDPPDHFGKLSRLISEDKKSAAVKYYMTRLIGMPAVIPAVMQLMPMWRQMKANAASLPYDAAVFNGGGVPRNILATIHMPTLVLGGEKSQSVLQKSVRATADLMPQATLEILKGQTHNVSAGVLAPALIRFFTADA